MHDATMQKLTATDPESHSPDLVADNLAALRTLFPELITEGADGVAVNVDVLKALVGDKTVTDGDEKYGLNWHGKRRARQLALTPSTGTLRPCPEDSVDWDTTQNLMIEGDNLEALKLLQKSYAGKVKLIYIDPPYNTGKDFVYPDNYQDSIKHYLELTGQTGDGGKKLSSNTEASGRFHTEWLNMMFPRIKLAQGLLRQDGVMMISIDDNEVDNLRKICSEIFGEENFCGCFIWEKKKKPSFLNANMGSVTEYIVCYAKNRAYSPPFGAGTVEDGKKYPFNNAGNGMQTLTFPAGSVRFLIPDQIVRAQDMSEGNIKTELLDDVEVANGVNINDFRLRGEWRYSQSKLSEFVEVNAEIIVSKIPFRPNYVNRSGELKKSSNLLSHRTNGVPTNEDATDEIRRLFGADVMSHPKPSGLLKYLIRAVTEGDDIVMDFFAGSGTTAHAVWSQNLEDGARRKFILVQLPEPLDANDAESRAAFDFCASHNIETTIAGVCRERLRRTAKSIKDASPLTLSDLGFKTFRLDSSNMREWDCSKDRLEQIMQTSVDHIKDSRGDQDILFELLLRFGLPLTVGIDERLVCDKQIFCVGTGVLFVCLASYVNNEDVDNLSHGIIEWRNEIGPAGTTKIVFRDSAFVDDVAKVNLTSILEQHDLSSISSI
jgi:adenine-specific DNA-methyltransferase